MVLSCATPCIQGLNDSVAAAAMAINVNNQLASAISNSTERFGAFAALSMHNATEAALELQRSVKELGFLGILFMLFYLCPVQDFDFVVRRIVKRLSTIWV